MKALNTVQQGAIRNKKTLLGAMVMSVGMMMTSMSASASVTEGTYDYIKSYKQDLVGVDNFKIWLDRPSAVHFETRGGWDTDEHIIRGDVSWEGQLHVFGRDYELVNFSAWERYKLYTNNAEGDCEVKIMGSSRVCDGWTGVAGESDSYLKTFVDVEKTFTIGIIPVKVRAKATGE